MIDAIEHIRIFSKLAVFQNGIYLMNVINAFNSLIKQRYEKYYHQVFSYIEYL